MTSDDICIVCGKERGGGSYTTNPDTGEGGFACWDDLCQKASDAWSKIREKREIAKLKKQNRCMYMLAWVGYCGKSGHPVCKEHSGIECGNRGCTNQAVVQCDFADSLVCGKPICKKCSDKDGGECQYHATTYKSGKQEYKYPEHRTYTPKATNHDKQ